MCVCVCVCVCDVCVCVMCVCVMCVCVCVCVCDVWCVQALHPMCCLFPCSTSCHVLQSSGLICLVPGNVQTLLYFTVYGV